MDKYHILLDCDPGLDDAAAIALAAAYGDRVILHGITTVAGNQTIDRVTENALKLVSFLHMDVPVARGSSVPLIREAEIAEDVHGTTGLGNCELPKTDRKEEAMPAVPFMAQQILNLPKGQKMTLVPTGPLTNIALLLAAFPNVREKIDQICLMGGAAVGGNMTPTGEFNIWEDPEAAQMVFASGLPIVMCGMDVTMQCGLTREQIDDLQKSSGRVSSAYGEMMDFYFNCPSYEGEEIAAVHDAVTIMYLVHPELFSGERLHVTVDCSEGINRGMTVCDMRTLMRDGKSNVLVLNQADGALFQKYLLDAIYGLDEI